MRQFVLEADKTLCDSPRMSTSPQIDALISRIREFRHEEELSRSALALRAGLSRAALAGMDRPDWGPTADTIRKLEAIIPKSWSRKRRRAA